MSFVPAENRVIVQGRSAGMPVQVPAFKDGGEWGCVLCYKRFPDQSGIVAHVAEHHVCILYGGNSIR